MEDNDLCEQLVVIQATPFCNLDCSYCYLPDRSDRSQISLSTLTKIFSATLSRPLRGERVRFLWHAGEPLALKRSFYEDAFSLAAEVASRFGRPYVHSLQTNGTLLSADWIDMFEKHSVEIGVSIDGPAFLHDAHRRYRSGRASHAQVMRGIRLLQDSGRSFTALAVLTDFALEYADPFFDFFRSIGIRTVGLNIEEIEGPHRRSSLDHPAAADRYQAFMYRLCQRFLEHDGVPEIRELTSGLRQVLHGRGTYVDGTNQPGSILSFDVQGRFCTFSPELLGQPSERFRGFVMGDIHRDSLDSIDDNPVFQQVSAEIAEGKAACLASCRYWEFCGGGQPANKYFEHGSFAVSETMYCRLYKQATIDAITDCLRDHMSDVGIC